MTVGAASATDMPIATRGRNTIIDTGRAISLPVAAALIFIALWEFVCHFYAIRPVLLPAPSLIVSTMFRTSSILWDNAIPTTMETVGGFVLSAVLGSALAVVMLYSKLMREVLYPNIVLFQLIPKIALAPSVHHVARHRMAIPACDRRLHRVLSHRHLHLVWSDIHRPIAAADVPQPGCE